MFPGTGTLVFVDDQRLDSRTHVLSISLVFTIISTARIANLKARLRKFHAMFKYISNFRQSIFNQFLYKFNVFKKNNWERRIFLNWVQHIEWLESILGDNNQVCRLPTLFQIGCFSFVQSCYFTLSQILESWFLFSLTELEGGSYEKQTKRTKVFVRRWGTRSPSQKAYYNGQPWATDGEGRMHNALLVKEA